MIVAICAGRGAGAQSGTHPRTCHDTLDQYVLRRPANRYAGLLDSGAVHPSAPSPSPAIPEVLRRELGHRAVRPVPPTVAAAHPRKRTAMRSEIRESPGTCRGRSPRRRRYHLPGYRSARRSPGSSPASGKTASPRQGRSSPPRRHPNRRQSRATPQQNGLILQPRPQGTARIR